MTTTVNQLNSVLPGRKIIRAWTDWKPLLKYPASLREFNKTAAGLTVGRVSRTGKYVVIDLSSAQVLLIHQKMTGHLLFGRWQKRSKGWQLLPPADPPDKTGLFVHFLLKFQDGSALAFSDVRKFGRVLLGKKETIFRLSEISSLGPDALEVNQTIFEQRVRSRKKSIKAILLDQTIIAGIGNIYSDEALWRARIHPCRSGNRLTSQEALKIWRALRDVLREAILARGTSYRNYRTPDGKKGLYQFRLRVYGREGRPCQRCSQKISSYKSSGRTVRYCPRCQPSRRPA